jgi:hypothetical protein
MRSLDETTRASALLFLLCLFPPALCAQDLVWKEFRSAADGFSVLFPGTPRFVEEKDQEFVHHRYTVRLDGRGFNVTCSDAGENIPERVVERLMTNYRDSMVKRMKAKLLEDRPLKCDAYPGRQFTLAGPEAWVSVKMCVAGRRSCVAQATHNKGRWPADVVNRFHNSFKLFPPTAK